MLKLPARPFLASTRLGQRFAPSASRDRKIRYHSSARLSGEQKWTRFPKLSRKLENRANIDSFLRKPSWDISALLKPQLGPNAQAQELVSIKEVQHIQRLSALRVSENEAENEATRQDLEAQLNFVRAVQDVDTEGVEPLVAIRDETEAARKESEITLDSLRHIFDNEEQVGRYKRIVPKQSAEADMQPQSEDKPDWDPLARAPSKVGRYIKVNTKDN